MYKFEYILSQFQQKLQTQISTISVGPFLHTQFEPNENFTENSGSVILSLYGPLISCEKSETLGTDGWTDLNSYILSQSGGPTEKI